MGKLALESIYSVPRVEAFGLFCPRRRPVDASGESVSSSPATTALTPMGGAKVWTGAAPGVTIPLGRCTDHHDTFGCHAWMHEVSGPEGPMVEVRRACVD